ADVHALGRAPRLHGRSARHSPRRRSGHQVGRNRNPRSLRVRLAAGGEGRASPGPHLALRFAVAAPHLVRVGVRVSRSRRRDRNRDQGRRSAHRRVPRVREGRAARQQDVLRRAHHAPAHQHRGLVPAGAQSGQEQGDRDEDAQGAVVRARRCGAGSQEGRSRQAEDRHRVGQSDSLVRVPAVHDGERSPHRAEGERRAQSDGRRSRSVHRSVPQALRQQGCLMEAARREKLRKLVESGIVPFTYRFERSASAKQAVDAYTSDDDPATYTLAGRLVALRPHGKTTFAHLEDASGKIQLYFKSDELGNSYALLELLDLGDHVGVEGRLMKTRTGEITLRVARVTLLAKALRPLPLGKQDASGVKHGELSDPELRYRQRYADLAVHPEVREVFRLRTRIVQGIRAFPDAKGYLEVETPVLQPLYGGAAAVPFQTHWEALDATFYLRIADELYLKRCLVGGLEKVYEIGHDFRNE